MSARERVTRRRRRLLVAVAFLLLVLAGGAVVVASDFLERFGEPDSTVPPSETRTIIIPTGLTASDVATILEREEVIASATTFLVELRLKGAAERIQPGTYQFKTGQDVGSVIVLLETGPAPADIRLTLPEGLSIDQAADRLDGFEAISAADYTKFAGEPERFALPKVGDTVVDPSDLEGLLFPSTYFVELGVVAEELIQLQLDTFESMTSELEWARASELGVDPYDVVIIASLIEKEARVPEERARVAAVIYNRLARNMPLGIDATTRFALKKWTGPLTKSDLAVDSPYNTRLVAGLPPGPIASPGVQALEATLAPADVDFLYYVLIDDEGHHFFTASYDEFLQAKAQAPGE